MNNALINFPYFAALYSCFGLIKIFVFVFLLFQFSEYAPHIKPSINSTVDRAQRDRNGLYV